MKDLKCGMTECEHNKGYGCCANCISVESSSVCASYSPDKDHRKNYFEAGEDFEPINYSVDTKIKCNADCVFNRDKSCISNGITMMGEENQHALCLTYIKK